MRLLAAMPSRQVLLTMIVYQWQFPSVDEHLLAMTGNEDGAISYAHCLSALGKDLRAKTSQR